MADRPRPTDPDELERAARDKTATVERQIKALDEMLASGLRRPRLTFESLLIPPAAAEFDPGPLGAGQPEPQWSEFAPARPAWPGRLFRAGRHRRDVTKARTWFEAARAEHGRQEAERQRAIVVAKAQHDREVTEQRAEAARHNARVAGQQAAFAGRDAGAVEWFAAQVLEASPYPDVFPREHTVAYRPENRDVVIEFELPPKRIVPPVRLFRYVRTRDAVEPLARPENEIKQRYRTLICAVALRTLHEIFTATPADVVEAVVFNGRVSSVDRATGKPFRPHLVSVCAERAAFGELILAAVDPVACLTHLNAIVSPDPFGLEAVQPLTAFDQRRSAGAGQDLLSLRPAEFEHLLRRLFEAMGAQAWTTIPAREGTVGAVVTSKNVFFGGACLVQAERREGLVGLDAVHALTGAMSDHNASTGVLITTSWFGRASEEYARRNRITLIDGAELTQAIKEHLGMDVVPGASPPQPGAS